VEKDQSLISLRQTSLAIIPTQAGNFVLPEITVPWFNTLTQQTEYATIPARSITVAPASGVNKGKPANANTPVSSSTMVENVPNDIPSTAAQSSTDADNNTNVSNNASGDANTNKIAPLYWVVTGVFIALFVIALAGWLYTYRKLKQSRMFGQNSSVKHVVPGSNALTSLDEKAQYQNLMSVIKAKDIRSLSPSLKLWINALTAGNVKHSQFESINRIVNELYALRFSANKSDASVQTTQITKVLEELSNEVKRTRNEWKRKDASDNHTLSNLYPAS
jgi:hypothetical protein